MTYTLGLENISLTGAGIVNDFVRKASESRASEIESAIHRFMDCGVELARFSIEEHPDGCGTSLCVDGVPRFAWVLVTQNAATFP
jgi:hypothetical protein